jgi:D-alanine--poly(phosphoribitol) ligase subunit 2
MTEARELETRITRLFAERLEVEVPSPDLDLFQAGVVDSLLFVKLLAILEEQFGFRLAFDELEIDDFRSVRQIARFVAAKGRAAMPGRVSASG